MKFSIEVGDTVELLESYMGHPAGTQGVVRCVSSLLDGEDALAKVAGEGISFLAYFWRLKVVAPTPSKATVEDAENLLAYIDQLEDTRAELAKARALVADEEHAESVLLSKIEALKEKLNIA